ncbi:MAG: GTP 3',8-cyclase MoaA [Planctomycetes bacterium]|nr:GTP 3',8-cyclase MoaA [Planctomycetota bacterium]
MASTLDTHGRPLRSLRISVTDRCNLRCNYCMPEETYTWLPQRDLLSFEELARLTDAFVARGVDRVRVTGGEPLLRKDLTVLVRMLAARELADLALTTNGVRLAPLASELRAAGLQRITVSLDTLDPRRFEALTRRDLLPKVLAGIEAARATFGGLKLDCVVVRGRNEDELVGLLDFARDVGAELRFIEYMDVGGATHWQPERVVSQREILSAVAAERGQPEAFEPRDAAPAERFRLPDGQVFGVIASTTQPFCARCDRSRLTADGHWFHCLYAAAGVDLLQPLRAGASAAELERLIGAGWGARADRGAEERLRLPRRRPLAVVEELRGDPHLEMHTRGG